MKIIIASKKVKIEDLDNDKYMRKVELELLQTLLLDEEELKDVTFKVGYEGDDILNDEATVKASYKKY